MSEKKITSLVVWVNHFNLSNTKRRRGKNRRRKASNKLHGCWNTTFFPWPRENAGHWDNDVTSWYHIIILLFFSQSRFWVIQLYQTSKKSLSIFIIFFSSTVLPISLKWLFESSFAVWIILFPSLIEFLIIHDNRTCGQMYWCKNLGYYERR